MYTPWFLFTEMGIEGNDIYSFLIYPPVSLHLSLSRVIMCMWGSLLAYILRLICPRYKFYSILRLPVLLPQLHTI